jgi:DinB superfamily
MNLKIVILMAGATTLFAQSGPPTITGEVKQNWARTKDMILRSAEKMPEDGYSLKATPAVRTFAQVIGHVSEAQGMICGGIVGQQVKIDTTKSAKAEVIAELQKSFAVCDKAYDQLNEGNAMQVGGSGFMGGTMVGRLYGNIIHDNEMYGTIVVYLRMKNIVPPSSEPRGR